MFDKAGISYTHFIRTTESHHIKKVEEVWVSKVALQMFSFHLQELDKSTTVVSTSRLFCSTEHAAEQGAYLSRGVQWLVLCS